MPETVLFLTSRITARTKAMIPVVSLTICPVIRQRTQADAAIITGHFPSNQPPDIARDGLEDGVRVGGRGAGGTDGAQGLKSGMGGGDKI